MSWTVAWEPAANTDFMYAWAAAPDPAVLWAGRDAVVRSLAADPYVAGRHLSEGLWVAHAPPLYVYSTIDPDRRRVAVTDFPLPLTVGPR